MSNIYTQLLTYYHLQLDKGEVGGGGTLRVWTWYLPRGSMLTINFITRDLKITHPVRLRRFRLKFNGIGRRGFNQQKKVAKIRLRRGFILLAAPDHDSPEKGLSAPETKRFLWW